MKIKKVYPSLSVLLLMKKTGNGLISYVKGHFPDHKSKNHCLFLLQEGKRVIILSRHVIVVVSKQF